MDTSWQKVGGWYDKQVGTDGHYYHEHVVMPKSLKLLNLDSKSKVLDLGCGQGVLSRAVGSDVAYTGVDSSRALIESARERNKFDKHQFLVGDVQNLQLQNNDFTHAAIILALQNFKFPDRVLKHAANKLLADGRLLLVINHPCFRIPRQSGWGIEPSQKLQYRWVNMYMSFLQIPINMHPGQKQIANTWSFHFSLTDLTKYLNQAGFVIETIEEWVSDKQSQGKAAKMENHSRSEIPLFMAIKARKILL